MRRKQGSLIEIEWAILDCAAALEASGERDFHGYSLAKAMRERFEARSLVAHGTLYKALDRLEMAGLLQSRWEDPEEAARAGRRRRRLYRLSAGGRQMLAQAPRQEPARALSLDSKPGRA